MGVRRAVDLVLDLQRSSPRLPLVTYGPLIHNPQTLELLESRGICQVESIEQIEGGTAVIRAHGISPQERKTLEEKGVTVIDATCPRVSRVQAVIRKHASKGHFCVIVGDADHPEVRGLLGFASAGGVAIASADKDGIIADVPSDGEICVVAQTTQQPQRFKEVVDILREHCAKVDVYDTICDSTRKRQIEVNRMAGHVDLIVVVGGKGSGNTRRLVKVAETEGVETLHVETDGDIPESALAGIRTVGVTAGASTPNWLIRRVIDRLKDIGMNRGHGSLSRLRRVFDVSVMTYLWAAAAGGGLATTCMTLQGEPVTWLPMAMMMMFVFSMHILNRVQDRAGAVRFNTPEIAEFYARRRGILTAFGIAATVACACLGFLMSVYTGVLLVALMGLGRLYAMALASGSKLPWIKGGRLRDLPGSKTPLVALGWAVAASILPAVGSSSPVSMPGLAVSFVFAGSMVFWRNVLADLLDMQGDRIVGRETIPILMGVRRTLKLLRLWLIGIGLVLAGAALAGLVPPVGFWLLLTTLVYGVFYGVYSRSQLIDRLAFEGLVDANLMLAGVIAIVYAIF
jgi:(E)-4-hydroxy-3-methyl-but-2-enyl pyrophosphate reductase